ncbi:hypothetical protein ACFPLB_15225 [Aquamicrobium segne]|uniref:Uncharacterized protein n=1 Tax=Aquamicrobium segne TaxID=469547 RepID=A0ABW0H0Q4_9HYPH
MSNKNTTLFAASMLAAIGAIVADHVTSEAPVATLAQEEGFNPCAAAAPPPAPGERNYDDIANEYSSDGAAAPLPAPLPEPGSADLNPCSAGLL